MSYRAELSNPTVNCLAVDRPLISRMPKLPIPANTGLSPVVESDSGVIFCLGLGNALHPWWTHPPSHFYLNIIAETTHRRCPQALGIKDQNGSAFLEQMSFMVTSSQVIH